LSGKRQGKLKLSGIGNECKPLEGGSAGADGEGGGGGGDDAAAARAAAADAAKLRTGLETAMAAAVVGPAARRGLHHTSVSLCLSEATGAKNFRGACMDRELCLSFGNTC
jgi:hypothetical protein